MLGIGGMRASLALAHADLDSDPDVDPDDPTGEPPGPQVAQVRAAIVAAFPRLKLLARNLTRAPDQAADLVQATCVRALERARTLQHGYNVQAWLFRIMRNLHVDELRSSFFNAARLDDEPPWRPEPVAAWRLVHDEQIERMVPHLPAHLRSVWQLVHEQQLDQSEIADRLGIQRATVASRIFRARSAMRQMLDVHLPTPPLAFTAVNGV